ncbi:MAG TPA: hypothetical protein VGE17_05705 [Methylophilus sp.]
MKKSLYKILLACSLLFAPAVQAEETKLVAPRDIVWNEYLGLNAQFLWFTPEQYAKQMEYLKALGLSWVRVDIHWNIHEPEQGKYFLTPIDTLAQKMEQQHLKSVFVVGGSPAFASSAPFYASNKDQYPPKSYDTFAGFMSMMAKRYPVVNAWQVWNEPNLPAFWQPKEDPVEYSKMLFVTTNELKRTVPDKTIVMAGMAYYSQMPYRGGFMLWDMASLGALNIGAITDYHPYSQMPEGDDVSQLDFVVRCREINRLLRNINVPGIWATEWGWSSYAGPIEEQAIVGESGQADFTLRRLALISALDFDKTFLFTLSDLDARAGARDQHYGLLDLNGKPKPVYYALKRFLAITGPRLSPITPPSLKNATTDVISLAWKKPDGTKLWMLWTSKSTPVNVTLANPAEITKGTLKNPLKNTAVTLSADKNGLAIPLTSELQILEWK